ncbi:hypothetical protein [Pedobacter sp. MR22-3]|uniref:hypothetical protein n=1 Tax=Pedobacter sp. MR22-3 TaxID=2994552 RepID=UPI0022477828|nr:hypothetical protein [Pedobacter sp. MR22-3]MCX2584410.1 hypothetical protein [Pedobacter sp. MR22-3]
MSNKLGLNIANSTIKQSPVDKAMPNDNYRGSKRKVSTTTEQRANEVYVRDKGLSEQTLTSKEKNYASGNGKKTTDLSNADHTTISQDIPSPEKDLNKQVKKNTEVYIKSVKQDKPVKAKGNSIFNALFNGRSPFDSKNSNGLKLDYGTGFNYGVKAGYNVNNLASNIYFGAYASFDIINNRWYLSPGFTINAARTVSGSYFHPSYFRPDSLPPFGIIDSRKIYVVDVPFNIGYRLSKTFSIKVGPVLSIPFKQTAIFSKVGYAPVPLDTMQHTKAIQAALAQTVLKTGFNLGISAGIGVQIRRFNIEATYQQSLMPYKVSSELGSYKFNSHSLMIGIGFQLNKGR